MSGKRVSNYKYCFVPWCTSTSVSCPDKIFFSVPENDKDRRKWLSLSRRDLKKSPLSPTTHLSCCEDHFDVTVLYNPMGARYFIPSKKCFNCNYSCKPWQLRESCVSYSRNFLIQMDIV